MHICGYINFPFRIINIMFTLSSILNNEYGIRNVRASNVYTSFF